MPTYGDETLHERYQREHADNLARLAKMTPEQIAEMELSFHNQIAELQTQLRLAAGDADEKDRLIEQLKYPQMCREARRADAAEAVKLQRLLMADHRECRPKGEGLMGWAAAALQAQMKELRCAQEPAFPVRVTGSLDEIDAQTWPFINEEARKVGAEEGHIEAYQYERANGGVVVLWNGPRVHAMAVTIRDDLNRTRCIRMLADSGTANAAPVEIEYPTYHAQGMGCGLEDRGITDRYEAMAYGFQEGLDQMAAIIDSMGPLYASPSVASGETVEILNLAEHLLSSEVFNNDGSVRSVTQEERNELRARIENHLGNTLVQGERETFQHRVRPWLMECFGATIAGDKVERNHRFLEEAIELVQACGCTADESHKLVDYVYGRPVGEKSQEVGGVMVTLAALCLAQGLDMHKAGEIELSRITEPAMVERIREKQKRKPAMSPLPGSYPERQVAAHGWRPAIRIELVSVSPGSGLHIRVWNDLAGLEPGTYELYLPVQP